MNKNELVEIIREVVRSELKNIGPSLVREALLESLGGTPSSQVNESIQEQPRPAIRRQSPVAAPKKEVKYSSNPILNQILNETSGGIPGESGPMALPSLEDSIPQEVIAGNAEVAGVLKATKRDYRSLLKAMDKKRP